MDEQQATAAAAAGMGMVLWVYVALCVFAIIAVWKVFSKAGQPGWAAIIPIYNMYVLLKVAGKPGWWLILFFIPIANLVAIILVSIAVAQNFGRGGGTAVGLILLPIIFYAILGFGSAQYVGPRSVAPAI